MTDVPTVSEAWSAVKKDVGAIGKKERNKQQGLYRKNTGPAERLWPRATEDEATGCWLWDGAVNNAGYGVLRYQRKARLAHRFAYELAVGPIPEGLTIDHLCRTRRCINPAHMEVVSRAENGRRGERTRLTRSGGRRNG